MTNSDITRLINSDEVQSKVRPAETTVVRKRIKKNPLKNLGVKVRLNPYALSLRRSELLAQERRAEIKAKKVAASRKAKKFHKSQAANYNRMVDEGRVWEVEAPAVEEAAPAAAEEAAPAAAETTAASDY